MAFWRIAVITGILLCSVACGNRSESTDQLGTIVVTLPDGQRITAEMMVDPRDRMRGMMFRDSLPNDRGMLFIHEKPDKYRYWMYQVKVPLDILWLNRERRVVEISKNTPACTSKSAQQCPTFGGTYDSSYALELAAGSVDKHGIDVGDMISF